MKDYKLSNIYNFLNKLKDEPSRNGKEIIIKNNKDILDDVKFLFDDMIVTGLAIKKINKDVPDVDLELLSFNDVVYYLLKNNTGRDYDVAIVNKYIKNQPNEYHDFLKQVFTKTFKSGVTASTINKALGEKYINEFKVQLAHPYEKFSDRDFGEFSITTKLDGHRTLCFYDGISEPMFFTRKGKPIKGLNEIAQDIKNNISTDHPIVLDGEVIVKEYDNKKDIFQETSKIIRSKSTDKKGLKFVVFDTLSQDDFWNGESKEKYLKRYNNLQSFNDSDNLSIIKHLYRGTDKSVIANILMDQINNDEEGIMINTDTTYKTKRHPGLLKVKQFYTNDLLCTGTFDGEGKYKSLLGGIYVKYKDNIVAIGSGFTDKEREQYYNNPDMIVGKIVEIQYFEESTNQNNNDISLRFPTFKGIRDDKDINDINIEI